MKRCILTMMSLLTALGTLAADTVRVAAVQCPSTMGKTADNLRNIISLVRKAAAQGAKIVVMPECAVQGYLDPNTWTSWSKTPFKVLQKQCQAKSVVPYGFDVIAANWTSSTPEQSWPGCGYN